MIDGWFNVQIELIQEPHRQTNMHAHRATLRTFRKRHSW
jgi:hypothetical protein